ncbi:hypothetical protein KIN20_025926 [Parelaphostrongylus tenuis]|uniref:Uncharacterized protein n=1 Tax=Parelaphostrongylus tenuis TaxID=148309 RepID=A0AAD5N9B6_PARTN|nr:hypothetical protein KIN20_025926 [Parelaphostrongylus tenuis]
MNHSTKKDIRTGEKSLPNYAVLLLIELCCRNDDSMRILHSAGEAVPLIARSASD